MTRAIVSQAGFPEIGGRARGGGEKVVRSGVKKQRNVDSAEPSVCAEGETPAPDEKKGKKGDKEGIASKGKVYVRGMKD